MIWYIQLLLPRDVSIVLHYITTMHHHPYTYCAVVAVTVLSDNTQLFLQACNQPALH